MRVEINSQKFNTKTNFINNKNLSFGNQMFMYNQGPRFKFNTSIIDDLTKAAKKAKDSVTDFFKPTTISTTSNSTKQETKTTSSYTTEQKTYTSQSYEYKPTYEYKQTYQYEQEYKKKTTVEAEHVNSYQEKAKLRKKRKKAIKRFYYNTKDTISDVLDTIFTPITKFAHKQIEKIENNRETRCRQASLNWYDAVNKYSTITKYEYRKQELCSITGHDTAYKYKRAIKKLNKEIDHELMMQKLEKEFTKGKGYYNPKEPQDPFNPKGLEEIIPNKKYKSYDIELMRIINLFLANTSIIDSSSSDFKKLSGNYFARAAESIKEICNIGAETKFLERIPKLGIIPKALRIADQTRLIKCVKNDFNDVTQSYLHEGYVPLVDKYNSQYQIIKEFILQNCKNSIKNQEFSKKYILTLNNTHDSRSKLTTNLLKSYSKAGANLGGMCKQLNKKNIKDMAIKTISTFGSFF